MVKKKAEEEKRALKTKFVDPPKFVFYTAVARPAGAARRRCRCRLTPHDGLGVRRRRAHATEWFLV